MRDICWKARREIAAVATLQQDFTTPAICREIARAPGAETLYAKSIYSRQLTWFFIGTYKKYFQYVTEFKIFTVIPTKINFR